MDKLIRNLFSEITDSIFKLLWREVKMGHKNDFYNLYIQFKIQIIGFFYFLIFFTLSSGAIHGEMMKNLPLYDRDGNRFLLLDLINSSSKKLTILNFTSVHCVPCKKEVPELINIFESEKSNGLDLMLVFVGDKDDEIAEKLKELNVPDSIKIYSDPLSVALRRLEFRAVPVTYIISNDRIMVHKEVGYVPEKFESFKNLILKKLK